jgi:hypothetical protein
MRPTVRAIAWGIVFVVLIGCGTTRRTDTSRTATEQLLLSDAIDRSVSRIDFGLLSGRDVFLDTTYLGTAVDKDYIVSTLRQHMLSCGCTLRDKKDDAQFVVEVRAGVVGTDRHDLLFGTPATTVSLGALSPLPGTPTMFPEIALAKRTDQMGVAKIGVFAYERATGTPVWQSGSDIVASKARDLWVFGTGPFQRGNIYGGTKFAGDDLRVPLVSSKNDKQPPVRVARERVFNPDSLSKANGAKDTDAQAAKVKQNSQAGDAARQGDRIAAANHGGMSPAAVQSAAVTPSPDQSALAPPAQSGFASPASYQQDATRPAPGPGAAWPAANLNPNSAPASLGHDSPRSQFDAAWAPGK